jgi:hypothetical protein
MIARASGTEITMNRRRHGVRWGPVGAAAAVLLALGGCSTAPPPPGPPPSAVITPPPGSAAARAAAGGTARPAPDDPGVPPDATLPDEGGRSTSPEFTDWITETDTQHAWLLDPCSPTTYPTDRQRTGFKMVSQTGPEALDARQLAVYPSPEVAAEVMAGFRRALTACSTGSTQLGSRWQWVTQEAPDLGDDGFLAASTEGGSGFSPAGDRIAVARTGSAVFLAYGGGEFSTAEIDDASTEVLDVVRQFLDSV